LRIMLLFRESIGAVTQAGTAAAGTVWRETSPDEVG
jgi:hypothetical protein